MRRLLLFVALLASYLLDTGTARATEPDAFDKKITEELRTLDPSAVDLFERANSAREHGDHAAAANLYGELFARVPAFVHAQRRQCAEYVFLGRRDDAIALCTEPR
jgi:hypothetical protein